MNGFPDEELLKNVVERPSHVDKLFRSRCSKYRKIAATLKVIAATKCLKYSIEEFQSNFGKNGISTMKTSLKRYDIPKPRIVKDGNTIYVWRNA